MANVRQMSNFAIVDTHFVTLIVIVFACTVSQALCSELRVLHHPKSIRFIQDTESVAVSEIHKLIANTFGLVTNKDLRWHGLEKTSLFSSPKANVLISIHGYIDQIPLVDFTTENSYPLVNDVPYVDVAELRHLMEARFPDYQPLVVDFSLDQSVVLLQCTQADLLASLPTTTSQLASRFAEQGFLQGRVSLRSLNLSQPAEYEFLSELQLIMDVVHTMEREETYTQAQTPDLYSFTVSSLQPLVEAEGAESLKVRDALAVLSHVFKQLVARFRVLYKDNVVVEAVTMATDGSEPKMRIARSLKEAQSGVSADTEDMGIAPDYSADFPAIFNIILWLMIALVIATFLIAHSIWFMDPGRDSIIYRMTSQRMKKDN